MNTELQNDYENLQAFWDKVFSMNEEEFREYVAEIDKDNDWRELAPAEKLLTAIETLKDCNKLLDYGCGTGWGAIAMAKFGATQIDAVETSKNAVDQAWLWIKAFEVVSRINAFKIDNNWLDSVASERYSGILCSNVLDVIPTEASDAIIKNFARITAPGAKLIIGMNFYQEPLADPAKNIEVKEGVHIFYDGILRLVSRTDEEWADIFSKYFTVEKIDHFAWEGETTERRRIFYLSK